MHFGRFGCFFLLFGAVVCLTGCETTQLLPSVSEMPVAEFPEPSTTPPSTTTLQSTDEWIQLQPGLERRTLEVTKDGQHLESLYILRLEPVYFRFRVGYDPDGLTLERWQEQTGALMVINGGYFWKDGEQSFPNGLTVIDGEIIGISYDDFGGMFAVTESGPDLRWLAQQPYDPEEQLLAALQSFPILVKPGGEIGFPLEYEDHISARRSVIAQDQAGRFLFAVAPQGNLTLHQLSAYLTNADLDIAIAVNLDGGPSSGILLADPVEVISSISLLPIVITVLQR